MSQIPVDLGDVVPLQVLIRDPTGTLANAGTVTVTVTAPDGTVDGPNTILPTTTGTYDYDFTPASVGRHTVRWVATGANASAYSDVFDVEPGDMGSIVSLADAKAHLNMTATRNDEELRLHISAATALVEHVVGPVTQTTHSEIVDAAETIVLAKAPVLSLTSVVQTFPYFGLPLTTPQYVLDGPAGILRMQPWAFGFGFAVEPFYGFGGMRLTVTYTTGRPSIPAAIRLAALIIIRHLWETQRLAGARPAGGDDDQMVGNVDIPSRAYELMAPYRRAPVIA